MIYIRGALYVLCMAINRLYPNAKIRTEYQLHNAMYVNITNIELTEDMIKDIELEMKNIVNKDFSNFFMISYYINKFERILL